MANRDECFSCKHLVQTCRMTNVKRKDGNYEIAAWFSCDAWKMPLPTITVHDRPGCMHYTKGEKQVKWYEPVEN